MLASPEISRNAQPGKVKAAQSAMGNQRGQGQYKGRSRVEPQPSGEMLWAVLGRDSGQLLAAKANLHSLHFGYALGLPLGGGYDKLPIALHLGAHLL